MKNALLLLIACLSLASCRTYESIEARHQRIAQRKLRKALKHDPTILQRQYTDTTISGIATGVVDVNVPGIDIRAQLDYDSIMNVLNTMTASGRKDTGVFIYDDSVASIAVKLGATGKPSLSFNVKPRVIYQKVNVPYEKKVSVPGKTFKQLVKYPVYTYWWFWILCVTNLLFLALWLRSIRKNQSINIINAEEKTTD